MNFSVKNVIDGDTFTVNPNWKWGEKTGDTVRVSGYDTPEEGHPDFEGAKKKLENLIAGEDVDLRNVIKITYGRLLCDVYCKGNNLKDYFPEYQ